MANAIDVAKYILSFVMPDEGELISHLKLQKLLYYCQGAYLAIYEKPLFSEDIYAWNHGPVVRVVWDKYKSYGSNPIQPDKDFDYSVLSEDEKEVINDVYEEFGQYSAWKLRNMTHEEPPWKETKENMIISTNIIQKYFKTLLVE